MNFDPTINFEAIATVLAAIVALVVYCLHRKDEKKKASIILLSEIRDAEQAIKDLQITNTVSDFTSVLNENHWKGYQYLFATSLDSDEVELVKNFYKSCEVIEKQLSLIKGYLPLTLQHKALISQEKLIELADRTSTVDEFNIEKTRILDRTFWPNQEIFTPYGPQTKLFSYINKVQFVISSSAGTKLKKIANAPWYRIFI